MKIFAFAFAAVLLGIAAVVRATHTLREGESYLVLLVPVCLGAVLIAAGAVLSGDRLRMVLATVMVGALVLGWLGSVLT